MSSIIRRTERETRFLDRILRALTGRVASCGLIAGTVVALVPAFQLSPFLGAMVFIILSCMVVSEWMMRENPVQDAIAGIIFLLVLVSAYLIHKLSVISRSGPQQPPSK